MESFDGRFRIFVNCLASLFCHVTTFKFTDHKLHITMPKAHSLTMTMLKAIRSKCCFVRS